MTTVEVERLPADCLPGDAVVALYFSDQKPLQGPAALLDWRLDGQVTRLLLDGQLSGKAGEHLALQSNGKLKSSWALFVGGGKWNGLCRETYASLIDHALKMATQAGFAEIALCLSPHDDADEETLTSLVEGALKRQKAGVKVCRLSHVPLSGENKL